MAKYKDGTTYKIFRQEVDGKWTRLTSRDDKDEALERLAFERRHCPILPIVLQECVKKTIDYGTVKDCTVWYRYRWVFSEGHGDWQYVKLPIDLTTVQVRERMEYVEQQGFRHGCRWSNFEYEQIEPLLQDVTTR